MGGACCWGELRWWGGVNLLLVVWRGCDVCAVRVCVCVAVCLRVRGWREECVRAVRGTRVGGLREWDGRRTAAQRVRAVCAQ